MTYKCNNCGHIFEEGEATTWKESHGFTDGFYETFAGCPMCRGDYEETTPCRECLAEKTEEELYNGFCKECLEERLTAEIAVQYLEENALVIDFAFTVLFDVDTPNSTSKALYDFVLPFVKENASIEQFKAFIFEDDSATEHFAEWLAMSDHIERG